MSQKIICFVIVALSLACNNSKTKGHGSTVSVEINNENIKASDIRIDVEGNSGQPKITIWDGEQKEAIPAYGVEGVKWFIIYRDSLYGEFVHSKIVMNQPLQYGFVFNMNKDSLIFVQANIPQSGGDFGERIKLAPKTIY